MRGLNRLRDFLAQFREQLGNNAISGKALPVLCLEKLFSDDPVGIDKEVSRPGKTFLHAGGLRVKATISPDGVRIGVRQHRVFDLVPVGEIFQDFFRVVTDGRQLDSLLLESWDSALQLDQLPLAERSPIRGTEKEKNGAVRSFQTV